VRIKENAAIMGKISFRVGDKSSNRKMETWVCSLLMARDANSAFFPGYKAKKENERSPLSLKKDFLFLFF